MGNDSNQPKKLDPEGFGDYIKRSSFYANIPDNPYAQQYMIVHRPPVEIKHPDEIIDGTIQMAYLKDGKTMLIYQRDGRLLTRLFDMASRSIGLGSVFETLYYGWRGEIKMTSALEGKERNLQSFLEPEMSARGFTFPWTKKKKAKQKKQLMDYMVPEDQGGGIYD